MDFVYVEGEDTPKIIYAPYIYAKIDIYERYYSVDNGKKIELVEIDVKKTKKKK